MASTSTSSNALLVDRFVSASSADDARDSLQGIVTALQATGTDTDTDTAEEDRLEPSTIWQEEETLEAFLQVLTSGEYKGIPIDQGPPLVCQIYAEFLKAKDSSVILQKPQPGRLVQSLLDVICNTEDSAYARVSALQVLQKISNKYPSLAQTHLLEVPNGLHRLADMFREHNEQVRNEVLLLAKVIAQWPSCAKIWVFADVCDSVIDLAVQEGGLTNGNVLVMDCFDLLHSLLKHDSSLSDLVWQSPVFANKFLALLDLRRGTEFLNPKKPLPTDDLDDILQSGSEETKPVIPRLTPEEERLLGKVLDLTGVMLGSETIRQTVWKRHVPLGSLIWELSLLSPPPPGVPYVCAVPSATLQQKALNCVAEFFSSIETMQRHNGLDRLLYLVCTGGASTKFKEKLALSQSALHVIRQTLSDDTAKEIVMHTLAPPTSEDISEPKPSVVLKLLNTVMQNVNDGGDMNLNLRKINLLGSLGGLGVFMRDATTREMMLRITSPHDLIDVILESLETQDEFIALSFLRFLSEWMVNTPPVVEAVLSSTQSTSLSVMFGSAGRKGVFTGLLLGMAMEYMDDQESEKYGGWTRASILTMISKRTHGISGFMRELEALKTADLPWKACRLEEKMFLKWYNDQVLVVRSRVVQELARGSGAAEDEDQGTGSSALQKVVEQQSRELQDLQAALAGARSEVESRDSQLSIWKRRMESNSTQLDDMLSEYTDKNTELEKNALTLRSELKSLRGSYETQLVRKDEQIGELQKDMEERRVHEEEASSDSDRLRGELAALSSAYSNLEEEYNRSQRSSNGAATLAEEVGQQPEGEVSSQGQGEAASDADTLRTENIRLTNDARAADEWMQLAHQRMGEIGSQNLALQQELDSVKATLSETGTPHTDDGRVDDELEEAKRRCDELEREIAALKGDSAADETVHATVQHEQLLRKELEKELENAQLDVKDALNSLGQSKSNKEDMLREIDELKSELQLASASVTALNEERRQLERKLETNGNEVSTEGELMNRLHADLEAKQQELDSLQASIKSLQGELASARSDVGLSVKESDATSNDAPPGEFGESDPNQESQAEELEQLRASNKAAQEWMESAVEHHRMLSEQVANLTADKEELKRQQKDNQDGADNEMTKRIQEGLVSRDAALERLTSELEQIQTEALQSSSAFEATKESLESEVSRLQAEVFSQVEEHRLLEEKMTVENTSDVDLKQVQGEVQSLLETNRELKETCEEQKIQIEGKLDQIRELSDERDTKSEEFNDMTVKLNEFEKWSAAAQERLALLNSEKEATEQQFTKLEAIAENSSGEVQELESANEKLNEDNKYLGVRLETFANEFEVQSARVSELQSFVEAKEVELASIREDYQQARADLEETEKEALVVTQQWQERVVALEADVSEMKESLAKQEGEASDVIAQWTQRCAELEHTLEKREVEIQELSAENTRERTARIDELESTIRSLEITLEAQQLEGVEAVEQWSSRCIELDEVVNQLSSQCETLSTEKLVLESRVTDAVDSSEKEQELKESLSLQIQLLENDVSSSKIQFVQVSEENDGLNEKVESQEVTIAENKAWVETLEQKIVDLRTEMEAVQSTSITSAERTKERMVELESALAFAEERFIANEKKTNATVEEWESRCQSVEEDKSALSKELECALLEKESLVKRLESKVDEIAEQLEAERDARLLANHALGDAETQIDAVAKQSEEVINQWQERVVELESANSELETQLEQQQIEAMDVISQWEGTCGDLEKKVTGLKTAEDQASQVFVDVLRTERKKHFNWLNMVVEDYNGNADIEIPSDTPVKALPALLFSLTERSDEAMINGISELKKLLRSSKETSKALEDALDEKEEKLGKSTQDISNLQSLSAELDESAGKLEEKCAAMEQELSKERDRNGTLEVELQNTKTKLGETTESNTEKESEINQHVVEMSSLRVQLEAIREDLSKAKQNGEGAEKTIQSLSLELSEAATTLSRVEKVLEDTAAVRSRAEQDLKAQKLLTLELEANQKGKEKNSVAQREQCDDLQTEVVLLEGELKSVNESLQVHITDEVSRRATEMATQALRLELDHMRSHIDGDQDVMLEERRARLAAEQEASNLRKDLALVLRVTDEEGSTDEKIKSLVMKTSDRVQRKERQEIDGIRKSLGRSTRELESSRGTEVEALSRAAAAELQASICEQEIISAKSDVAFLTQSLEETRESEAARVASFEYRVCALEDDRDVVRRYHADEIETLRNELSHILMEKDRILHSLKESEKTNTALVYETSKEQETEVTEHVENELSKLRTSNTRLLSAASEEGARTERRIREAIAANASLVEADVIVERELRVAAETALENVKSQLEERRRSSVDDPATGSNTQTLSPVRMRTHLSHAREKSRKLEAENSTLKVELKELESTSETELSNLTDECRRAQALVLKLEGAAKFGSAVNLEATKMQLMPNQPSSENWIVVSKASGNVADASSAADGLPSTEAYDCIMTLKSEIHEERQMYQELLAEHDDLLALLAQQDLEKSSLNQALTNVAGQRAVDAAIQQAEANAIEQFGKYVRLTS
mmetsp:Transcript_15187/g.25224  ORF Transcript_15187/g.25224 Transcript_15187/m.25224 type:complete len:2554 (+) Transcript_15187:278-7939(+)